MTRTTVRNIVVAGLLLGSVVAAAPGPATAARTVTAGATAGLAQFAAKPAAALLDDMAAEVRQAADEQRARTGAARAVCYKVHLESDGWVDIRCDGADAGTTGKKRRLEAIIIQVSSADGASVCYNAHVQSVGWQGVKCNGQVAGTTGSAQRLEAIQVIAPTANGSFAGICTDPHVEGIGWMGDHCNGATAGTVGQKRRMEAIRIRF